MSANEEHESQSLEKMRLLAPPEKARSLPQVLRAIDFYIDDLEGTRLLQISRRGQLVTIPYETASGSCTTEEFTPGFVV